MKKKYTNQSITSSTYHIENTQHIFIQDSPHFRPFVQNLAIYPSYNNTHIIMQNQYPRYCITNFDKNGKPLKQYTYSSDSTYQPFFLSDSITVLLQKQPQETGTLKHKLLVIDWKNNKNQQISLYFQTKKQYKNQVQLIIFKQSKIICICQYIHCYPDFYSNKTKQINLFFYTYNQQLNKLTKIHTYQHKIKQTRYQNEYKIKKINQISKITILSTKQMYNQQFIQFYIYDYKYGEFQQLRLKECKIQHGVKNKWRKCCEVVVNDIWEIGEQLLSFGKYWKHDIDNIKQKYDDIYEQVQYIWDYGNWETRKPTYQIKDKFYNVQFIDKLRPIQNFTKSIPNKNPTNKQKFQKNQLKSLTVPIYLISRFNNQQFIEDKIQPKNIDSLDEQFNPIFIDNKIYFYQFVKLRLNVKILELKQRKFNRQQALVFLAMDLVRQGCDQDLLYKIVQLTKQEQKFL